MLKSLSILVAFVGFRTSATTPMGDRANDGTDGPAPDSPGRDSPLDQALPDNSNDEKAARFAIESSLAQQ